MKQCFFVGTYTEPILFGTGEVFQGKGEGIYYCAFEDGQIAVIDKLNLRNPSYFCINQDAKKIYAVNEMKKYNGHFGGGLTQISFEGEKMCVESDWFTNGTDPCHVEIDPGKSFLSVANFSSGSITIYPLDKKGNIICNGVLFQHKGSSIHPIRQRGPHAHSSVFSPREPLMYVPDLGIDMVKVYRCENGEAHPAYVHDLHVAPGSGPRFGSFTTDGERFYLINEISSEVAYFSRRNGKLELIQTISTLPEGANGSSNICSDLHLNREETILYASNRGHDSLCVFAIAKDGTLSVVQYQKCAGRTPRNFSLDPTGKYVLVGNQDSDTIEVLSIEADGTLKSLHCVSMPSPVCIRFLQ